MANNPDYVRRSPTCTELEGLLRNPECTDDIAERRPELEMVLALSPLVCQVIVFGEGVSGGLVQESWGSGFILGGSRWIVTNTHVVEKKKSSLIAFDFGTFCLAPRPRLAFYTKYEGRFANGQNVGDMRRPRDLAFFKIGDADETKPTQLGKAEQAAVSKLEDSVKAQVEALRRPPCPPGHLTMDPPPALCALGFPYIDNDDIVLNENAYLIHFGRARLTADATLADVVPVGTAVHLEFTRVPRQISAVEGVIVRQEELPPVVCIEHTAHSQKGSSGSPLIVFRGPKDQLARKPFVAGVHFATADPDHRDQPGFAVRLHQTRGELKRLTDGGFPEDESKRGWLALGQPLLSEVGAWYRYGNCPETSSSHDEAETELQRMVNLFGLCLTIPLPGGREFKLDTTTK